ncbi:MAG: dienelactone hydrolase family protein [Pseudomonadota bacterium]
MSFTLDGPRRAAKSGTADALVLLLHGYGADGNDLIGLADVLADHLPTAEFRSPNAPQACTVNPMGRQWFPIPQMDGSTEAQRNAGFAASQQALNAWLDQTAEDTGVPAARTLLLGFSQGTMMSLHAGPRRQAQLAGIVGFSGRLLAPEKLPEEIASKPPVLLLHGDMDEVVPFADMEAARKGLEAAGLQVATHVMPRAGHSISPDGLGAALAFIKARLA